MFPNAYVWYTSGQCARPVELRCPTRAPQRQRKYRNETDTPRRRKPTADAVSTPDEISARRAGELPTRTFEAGWIRRKYKSRGWKGTLMVVDTARQLAEAARQTARPRKARRTIRASGT